MWLRLQVQTQLTNHVAAMAPAALIGIACGLLAIAFTVINLKVARFRMAALRVRMQILLQTAPDDMLFALASATSEKGRAGVQLHHCAALSGCKCSSGFIGGFWTWKK